MPRPPRLGARFRLASALLFALLLFTTAVAAQVTGGSFGGSSWGSSGSSGSSSSGSSSSGSSSSDSSSWGSSSRSWDGSRPSDDGGHSDPWAALNTILGLLVIWRLNAHQKTEGLAWIFPTSALKGMPVSRAVDGRRVEGFIVGHVGDRVRFSEDPTGPGELVEPEALTRHPETSARIDARRERWAVPVDALWWLTAALVVSSWLGAAIAPYRSITEPTLGARLQLVPVVFLGGILAVLLLLRAAAHGWRPAPARLFDAMGEVPRAEASPESAPPEPVVRPSAQRSSDRRGGLHVGTLSLAFDATARRQIQASLETVARSAALSSSEGLGEALRSTATVLAEHGAGLQAGHGAVEYTRRPEASQRAFEKAVTAERGRYVIERVRVDADGARTVATASEARSEEGGGFVVVTLVVAWDGPGDVLDPVISREELDALVWRLQRARPEVKALEVVWVPADPEDVMSSAEMGTVFPHLAWLDAAARRRFGQAVCAYCKAVYTREIGPCPNCGAIDEVSPDD